MAFVTDFIPANTSVGVKVSDFIQGWVARAEKRAIYTKTVNELQELSNRELADLGICRSAIKGIALEAAYK